MRLMCRYLARKLSKSAMATSDKELFSGSNIESREHPIIMRTSGSSDDEDDCELSPVAIDMSILFRQKKWPCKKRGLTKETFQAVK